MTYILLNVLSDDKTKQQVASQVLKEMKDENTTTDLVKLSTLDTPMTSQSCFKLLGSCFVKKSE